MRDSVHGSMKDEVILDGNYLKVKDQKVRVISGGQPGTIPWDIYDVDIVIDASITISTSYISHGIVPG